MRTVSVDKGAYYVGFNCADFANVRIVLPVVVFV